MASVKAMLQLLELTINSKTTTAVMSFSNMIYFGKVRM